MRNEFSKSIEKLASEDKDIIFITGDLGYNAFENLQKKLENRFINSGVAEQSMVGIAAGLAKKGHKVFCYSIAPFVVYRCLEQIRNDVCFHNLPVFLVGNGGGYGYGIMGSSHHAISDLASISSLPNIKAWIPDSANNVEFITKSILNNTSPAYLRLGRNSKNYQYDYHEDSFNVYKNMLSRYTVIALGSLVENVMDVITNNNITEEINVLACIKLPISFNSGIQDILKNTDNLIVIEDHVSIGGLAQQISLFLHTNNLNIKSFSSLTAKGYPSGLYGNQEFHHKDSGIDELGIKNAILELIK